MIAFQFGISQWFNRKINHFNNSLKIINNINKNVLSAIIEEKKFLKSHESEASSAVSSFLKKASNNIAKELTNANEYQINLLEEQIRQYETCFNNMYQVTKELDHAKANLIDDINKIHQSGLKNLDKINEEISIALSNVEEVSETIRQISEITKNTLLDAEGIVSALTQDLLLNENENLYKKILMKRFPV